MRTTENIVMGDDPDWQTGEIVAENSIHLTHGFHGSADEEIHLHIGHINRTLDPEEWESEYEEDKSAENNENSNKNIKIETDIDIYPNPTNGVFTINSLDELKNILITDISGKIIYSQNSIKNVFLEIDISDTEQGIYLMKIITKNNTSTHKIIKL
jgi:Secretion system C-terminal sorting domain